MDNSEFTNNNVMLRDLLGRKDPVSTKLIEFYSKNFDVDFESFRVRSSME